jgi:hypothetical protein
MGGGGERLLMLDVARNRIRNMLTTRLQHARNMYSLNVASTMVRNMGKALRNIVNVVRNITMPRNEIDG